MSEQKAPLASVIMEVSNGVVDATYLAGGLEDARRYVGAGAGACHHHVGLIRPVKSLAGAAHRDGGQQILNRFLYVGTFNKEITLKGAFSGHGEISRSAVDSCRGGCTCCT